MSQQDDNARSGLIIFGHSIEVRESRGFAPVKAATVNDDAANSRPVPPDPLWIGMSARP